MIYALTFGLAIWLMIPVLMIWYLIKPSTYFLMFNGEVPSRLAIFTHHFLAFLLLFMLLGLGIETVVKSIDGTSAHLFFYLAIFMINVFSIYFGRNKINLGDKKRV